MNLQRNELPFRNDPMTTRFIERISKINRIMEGGFRKLSVKFSLSAEREQR
jgi:hypothetical protein